MRASAALLPLLMAAVAFTQSKAPQPVKMTVNKISANLFEIDGGGAIRCSTSPAKALFWWTLRI